MRRILAAGIVPATLLLVALSVQQTSLGAFRATTPSTSNRVAAGTVTLSDDDSNGAMFINVGGLSRGSTGASCIKVTYGGSLPAKVVARTGTFTAPQPIDAAITIVIDEGTGGAFRDCAGFTKTAEIYNGTIAAFITGKTSFATGVGSWTPSGPGSRTYRITYTVDPSAPASVQNTSTNFMIVWVAENT